MSKSVYPLKNAAKLSERKTGAKARNLGILHKNTFAIPRGSIITTDAFQQFINRNGLQQRIGMELNRKAFHDMRLEEIQDCSIRIRNMITASPLPAAFLKTLEEELNQFNTDRLAIRSSAPGEDTEQTSFAGTHDSFIDIPKHRVPEKIKQVWASLWSKSALVYRHKTGLDMLNNHMAVIIQELIAGETSGVFFTTSPVNNYESIVEVVSGLNEQLVDGSTPPQRLIWEKGNKQDLEKSCCTHTNLLSPQQLNTLFNTGTKLESIFGKHLDIEFTFSQDTLFLLQVRPAATAEQSKKQSPPHTLKQLQSLHIKITEKHLPLFRQTAEQWKNKNLDHLSAEALLEILRNRCNTFLEFRNIYTTDFIPFSEGMRLFGNLYNDTMHPDDPYEFINLLSKNGNLLSIKRNKKLMLLAKNYKKHTNSTIPQALEQQLQEACQQLTPSEYLGFSNHLTFDNFLNLLKKLADTEDQTATSKSTLQETFLKTSPDPKIAEQYLAIGRESYRLRDDDDLYIGALEKQLAACLEILRKKLPDNFTCPDSKINEWLQNGYTSFITQKTSAPPPPTASSTKARQIKGQPSGPGKTTGKARIIRNYDELFKLEKNEIIVCDAIDPNMTFVMPLASGIIERRGGMLVHGAIIAREYKLPCVTGIPEACNRIHTGDTVSVDGWTGIVTIHRPTL